MFDLCLSILYPNDLRALIKKLKNEGNFRPEGLKRINYHYFILSICLVCLISFILFKPNVLDHVENQTVFTALILIQIIFFVKIRQSLCRKYVLTYSAGHKIVGKISKLEYETLALYTAGYRIFFLFDDDGSQRSGRIIKVLKKHLNNRAIAVGDPIDVYVYGEQHQYFYPFIDKYFENGCIDSLRHQQTSGWRA